MKSSPQSEESANSSIDPHVEFQSQLPYMGLARGSLTMQQEKLVMLICSGMTTAAAGRGAGYSTPQAAYAASKLPAVQTALEYHREEMRETVKFTSQNAHMMYMEAYNASANATEMKNTTDSLVKLHGLAKEEEKPLVNININGTKQLERMSDEDLLKIAGREMDYLEPKSD